MKFFYFRRKFSNKICRQFFDKLKFKWWRDNRPLLPFLPGHDATKSSCQWCNPLSVFCAWMCPSNLLTAWHSLA